MREPTPDGHPGSPSRSNRTDRRAFLQGALCTAAAAMAAAPAAWGKHVQRAVAVGDPLRDALHGLLAFAVPGDDAFSSQQGVTATRPGGVDANVVELLILGLDASAPYLPGFSGVVGSVLDGIAITVDPTTASGPFSSPFANASFVTKGAVCSVMDADPSLAPLAAALLQIVPYLVYSEAGVYDPFTGTLAAEPLGWQLSSFGGVVDGHADFKGYFENRRKAE